MRTSEMPPLPLTSYPASALYWTALDTSDLWCFSGCSSRAARDRIYHHALGRAAALFQTRESKGKIAKIGPHTSPITVCCHLQKRLNNNTKKCRNNRSYLNVVQTKECAMNTVRKIPFAIIKRRPMVTHLPRSAAGCPGSRIQKCAE